MEEFEDDPSDMFSMMQSSIKNADVTTLTLGSAGSTSLNLKILDGDVTKQLLETCVTLIGIQARKMEQYEGLIKSFQDSDIGSLQSKVIQHQAMIENLVHNIQGYVDPEDTDKLGTMAPIAPTTTRKKSSRRKSTAYKSKKQVGSAVPGNFLSNTKSKTHSALPLSPKIRKNPQKLTSGEAGRPPSSEKKLKEKADESGPSHPSSAPVEPIASTPVKEKEEETIVAATEDATTDVIAENVANNDAEAADPPVTTNESDGELDEIKNDQDNENEDDEDDEDDDEEEKNERKATDNNATEDNEEKKTDSDVVSIVDSSNSTTTLASRKASANIAMKRFKKATSAVVFTNNLKRVSMLKTRAPKEFSLVERVSRIEEVKDKFDSLEGNLTKQIESVNKKVAELESLTSEGLIMQSIQSLGRRVQTIEMQNDGATMSTLEETTAIANNLKDLNHQLTSHLEKTTQIQENIVASRIDSLQQRVVETTNSYSSLMRELENTKMPPEDYKDQFRALKVLQFHNRVQTLRHRLTHLDGENMTERNEYYLLKNERTIWEKVGSEVSQVGTELLDTISQSLTDCVAGNLRAWEILSNIDKAASIAWGKVSRMMQANLEAGQENQQDKDKAPVVRDTRGSVSTIKINELLKDNIRKEIEDEEEANNAIITTTTNAGGTNMSNEELTDLVKNLIAENAENNLNFNPLGGPMSNNRAFTPPSESTEALKTMNERILSTSKHLEEIALKTNELEDQLAQKADGEAVDKVLRSSRMIQAQMTSKADAITLENVDKFVQKCRKEVVKLRTTQAENMASMRRILERKIKRVMVEVANRAESEDEGNAPYATFGPIKLASPKKQTPGSLERGVTWQSDKSKFIPSIPAAGKNQPIITKSGGFVMNTPNGAKGRSEIGARSPAANKNDYFGYSSDEGTRRESPAKSKALGAMSIANSKTTTSEDELGLSDNDILTTSPMRPASQPKPKTNFGYVKPSKTIKTPTTSAAPIPANIPTATSGNKEKMKFVDISGGL